MRTRREGFTLIEVVGALVLFAAGILMALRLTGALSRQVEDAAIRSEVVALAQEKMEELEQLPFDSLSIGTTTEPLTVFGQSYTRMSVVASYGLKAYSIEVVVEPADSASTPSHAMISYAQDSW